MYVVCVAGMSACCNLWYFFPQDLMSQKQKVASERERLQAELEHFRKCLVLPPSPWSRGYFKGHPRWHPLPLALGLKVQYRNIYFIILIFNIFHWEEQKEKKNRHLFLLLPAHHWEKNKRHKIINIYYMNVPCMTQRIKGDRQGKKPDLTCSKAAGNVITWGTCPQHPIPGCTAD